MSRTSRGPNIASRRRSCNWLGSRGCHCCLVWSGRGNGIWVFYRCRSWRFCRRFLDNFWSRVSSTAVGRRLLLLCPSPLGLWDINACRNPTRWRRIFDWSCCAVCAFCICIVFVIGIAALLAWLGPPSSWTATAPCSTAFSSSSSATTFPSGSASPFTAASTTSAASVCGCFFFLAVLFVNIFPFRFDLSRLVPPLRQTSCDFFFVSL
mmetsp:Transcript_1550/g.3367  ORF Transcript_1550/g.3367 Transcript_1550/m.3367 type:complete len:208 (+) Transcript_1550:1122-1745(+)